MKRKRLLVRLLYAARNWRSRALFDALRRHCRGEVLDVGGWDFFLTARRKRVPFDRWTTLETSPDRLPDIADPRFTVVQGDGCRMQLGDASFDTVVNAQVLEHVLEPLRMVDEIARVLRPGGRAILLVPQTSNMHLAPHFYSNFSRFWIREALTRSGLEILELRPLGGFWSSQASRLLFFFLQSARLPGMSTPECRRGPLFYLLFPLMAAYAVVGIPVCLLLSLGDLSEEPNNHLAVARKPDGQPRRTAGAVS